jgi:Zn finger protein HypA/HybF involved in hydrogenase expression
MLEVYLECAQCGNKEWISRWDFICDDCVLKNEEG